MAALLCAIYLASGSSALIFETLWFRQAGLAFGNSVWASSLVLSAFMSGLALGNGIARRAGDRLRHPVRVYAIAETTVAVTGVAIVHVLPALGSWLAPWLRPLLDAPWLLNAVRFAGAFLLLLIPSAAMGITLPLLTRALGHRRASFASALGRLYGWNTAGAVIGVILSEVFLIGRLGIRGAAFAAGALNLAAAAAAWWLPVREFPVLESRNPPILNPGIRHSGVWLVAAFVSGFCLLALEVVWFRFLLLFVEGHSIAFALMLAVVLAGIAAGALVAGEWLRWRPQATRAGGALVFAAACLSLISYAWFPLGSTLPTSTDSLGSPAEILRLALPLMFPVSALSGAFFAVAGAAVRHGRPSDAEAAGLLTLLNTAGAALGSLVAGLLLLPLLGIEHSLLLVAILYAGVGLLLAHEAAVRRRIVAAVAGAAVLAMLISGSRGLMASRFLQSPVQRYFRGETGAVIAGVREGLTETIVYVKTEVLGRPLSYRLLTNSFSMSSTAFPARRYMKLYAYLPMALHPAPTRALLIAYGVGNTAKAMTDSADLETIDVVDISRDILDMNRVVYPDPADHPLRDPRVRIHVEDGRYFLQTTNRQFDLITGEPPPPRLAGVVNLYTREYFRLLYDRLADGGFVTYWLPLADLSDAAARAILRAFCDAFRDCSLWNGAGPNLMMLGTRNRQGTASEERFTRQWQQPVVAAELRRLAIERPEQLGALFIGDADYVRSLVGDAPTLGDDHPKLLDAPQAPANGTRFREGFLDVESARHRFSQSAFIRTLWPARVVTESLPYFEHQGLINAYLYPLPAWPPFDFSDVRVVDQAHRLLTGSALRTLVLWRLGSDGDIQRIITGLTPAEQAHPAVQVQLGIGLLAERRYRDAIEPFARAERLPQLRDEAFRLRAYAMCMAGATKEAEGLVRERLAGARPLTPFWQWLVATFGLNLT